MPEMDGIEATAAIRAWEKNPDRQQIPVIALTANAVVGMREMFLENGFNDYLSKPIDISKLDEILNRWIPVEKKANNNEQITINKENERQNKFLLSAIPHVDTAKGIAMIGGKPDTYKKILSMFCKDIDERLPQLQIMPEANTLPSFIIQVHSLKSVSASIGAQEVSSHAAGLEAAGKAADMAFIREHLPDFTVQLMELEENIRAVLSNAAG